MKIHKIMMDLLKLVDKDKTINCNYGFDDEYIYYTPDGYRMFKIKKESFLIDMVKALPNKTPLNNPRKFFNNIDVEDAVKTDELKKLDKYTVVKIQGEKAHARINIDYLKEFDTDCKFKVSGFKNPVFIYENDEVVGLILPVRVKEDLDNDA